jgi:hypothetical protein
MTDPFTRHCDRKAQAVTDETARLRAACDELWRAVYREAAARIAHHATRNRPWCKVKVPFACDDEMEDWYEWVLAVATHYGYERRPGGSSGHGYDLVYFERPGADAPADVAAWDAEVAA